MSQAEATPVAGAEMGEYVCALYLDASRVKAHVARFHLDAFRGALGDLTIRVDWPHQDPPPPTLLSTYGHADGCVLQLVGSFDAWACAAGWALGHTSPDDSSFMRLVGGPPATIAQALEAVAGDERLERLFLLRHEAAHRGIVGMKRGIAADRPDELIIRTEKGHEVLPLLEDLMDWASGALDLLHRRAAELGWRASD